MSSLIPRRSRLGIMIEILRVGVDNPKSKTRFIQLANTSYTATAFLIEKMVKLGYLEPCKKKIYNGEYSKRKYYRTTRHGFELVKTYDKLLLSCKDALSDWNGGLG